MLKGWMMRWWIAGTSLIPTLYYGSISPDATQGDSLGSSQPLQQDEIKINSYPEVKDILSNKPVDVWERKPLRKASWSVYVVVKAPITPIPEVALLLMLTWVIWNLSADIAAMVRWLPERFIQWLGQFSNDQFADWICLSIELVSSSGFKTQQAA